MSTLEKETPVPVEIGALITRSPDIRNNQPRIAGTGVSVRRIVGWYKLGWTPEEITANYGHISLAQVYAALAYYHANTDEIEAIIAEEDKLATRLEEEHYRNIREVV